MDDRKAALLLALLALAGAGVRLALAPAKAAAPGDVRLVSVDTPPPGGLSATARQAARLARPLLPGERVDLDRADVTEITRLPRIGPAFAQRIVAWRERQWSVRQPGAVRQRAGRGAEAARKLGGLRHVFWGAAMNCIDLHPLHQPPAPPQPPLRG